MVVLIKKSIRCLWVVALFGVAGLLVLASRIQELEFTSHASQSQVDVSHVELKKEIGPSGVLYSAVVDSVFCRDGKCRVVPVQLYWNEIGQYHHLELAPGIALEKLDGIPFNKDDYVKLDQILGDRHSDLKFVDLRSINDQIREEDVHAVTSATPVVYEDSFVKGALWTCHTLWHFANGLLADNVKQLTVEENILGDYLRYIQSDKSDFQFFALEQLIHAKTKDDRVSVALINRARDANRDVMKLILVYFSDVDVEAYTDALFEIYQFGSVEQRSMVMNNLLLNIACIPSSFTEVFAMELSSAQTYQEVDLIFRFFEKMGSANEHVIEEAFFLLSHDDFFIARRAYWFLSEKPLTADQRVALNFFKRTHLENL